MFPWGYIRIRSFSVDGASVQTVCFPREDDILPYGLVQDHSFSVDGAPVRTICFPREDDILPYGLVVIFCHFRLTVICTFISREDDILPYGLVRNRSDADGR